MQSDGWCDLRWMQSRRHFLPVYHFAPKLGS
jgi:hypothetical protein